MVVSLELVVEVNVRLRLLADLADEPDSGEDAGDAGNNPLHIVPPRVQLNDVSRALRRAQQAMRAMMMKTASPIIKLGSGTVTATTMHTSSINATPGLGGCQHMSCLPATI